MTESHLASRLNALFALWEGQAPVAIVKDLLSLHGQNSGDCCS